MKDNTVNRRQFAVTGAVGAMGVAASIWGCATQNSTAKRATASSAGGAEAQAAGEEATLSPEEIALQAEQAKKAQLVSDLAALIAPYKVGSKVVETTLLSVTVDAHKRGVITLKDQNGNEHIVDICRRTNKAKLRGPVARTNDYLLYLRNGAKGSRPTNESVGLAIMALGDVVQTNEKDSAPLNLISKEEQWAAQKSKMKN